jgi:arginine decarboxylase
MEVGAVKAGRGGAPDWYLLNGSLMVSLPDTLIVEGQQFIVLPLDDWHMPVRPVRLAGRYTCDTDDYYPRSGQAPLFLPVSGERSVLAFFGIGAYQQMIAGRGGAHHCLTPEMRRIIIEYEDDTLVLRETPAQHLNDIMVTLGYHRDTIELRRNAATESADRTARVVRMPARRYVRPMRRMPR